MSINPADAEKELLRANIHRTREELVDTAEELRLTVRDNLHWRTWVGRHPAVALSAVLCLGVLLGSRRR